MTEVAEQTLHVVAKELTATLSEARAAIEAYAEHPDDRALLETCAARLHEVHGVLRLVEVYGAALLAEEMEHVAHYLLENAHENRNQPESLDALMRAMVQLPAYLERVLGGGRDLALVLLPLLNDLRAVRGHALLSEGTLLLLNLTSDRQPQPVAQKTGEPPLTVAQWARRLRPRFQVGLLGWIRGERPAQHLEILVGRRRAPRAGGDAPAGVPAVVGRRRGDRGAARGRPRGHGDDQAPARPGRPRAQEAVRDRRAALRGSAAARSAEQSPLLRGARRHHRPAHGGRARVVQAAGAAAGLRAGRAGAREPLGALGQADGDGGGRDQGRPVAGEGRARHLRPQGRRAGRGAGRAARDAAQDQRHARRARPRRPARQGAGRRSSGSRTSSPRSCRRTTTCWSISPRR